jgi:alkylation response protein AidB-like acyl-CoA dehydrogenase
MNLTEPQSGSDLATIKSRAEPAGDGSYLIHGQKIYITYGEQEWTENIIHLVLARLPHAPEGTRGISLFLVPKRLVDENGNVGDANEVRALRLEEKLGIHASPTCVMSYGETLGAVGYLVGEPHQGLGAMFTMMNLARLMVGTQGVAVAERATQQAQEFANVRLQGRRDGDPSNVSVPIIRHPDVKRMLVKMSALTAAARSICLNAAVAFDLSRHGEEENTRAAANARADLLTPIAKSFATDIGVDVASTGVQVHGGSGYMEETGAAQHLRDARILPIYEGTNGIQAIDLVLRKVARDNGKEAQLLIEEIRGYAHDAITSNDPRFCQLGYSLNEAVEHLADATDWVVSTALSDRDRVLAGACAYLRLFALTAGCGFLARGALGSVRDRPDHEESARAVFLTQFFSETILGESVGLHRSVTRTGEIIKAGGSQIKA